MMTNKPLSVKHQFGAYSKKKRYINTRFWRVTGAEKRWICPAKIAAA
jgi:hypothetical protein